MRYILIIAAAIVGILSPGTIRHRVRIEGTRSQNLSHLQTPIQQTGSHHNLITRIPSFPIIGTANGAGAQDGAAQTMEYLALQRGQLKLSLAAAIIDRLHEEH